MSQEAGGIFYKKMDRLGTDVYTGFCDLHQVRLHTMPDLSTELVSLLSYLLPGFLVAWIFYSLTTHQKPAQLERVIQALIFTLIVRGLVIVVREGLYLAGNVHRLGTWNNDSELWVSILLALALGLCVAYLTNTDTLHEWLRKKKISKRSSHPSEWCIVFAMEPTYVVIEFKDGRRLYGWPSVWPSNFEKGHLYITDPSWIHVGGPVPLPHNDGVLVQVTEIAHVEFLNRPESKT